MKWSSYQESIFDSFGRIIESRRDLVVMARAGTGKTTTMIEAVIRFCRSRPSAKVLTCAFNKRNAVELDDRLRAAGLHWKQASAKTLNSVGLSTVKYAFDGVEVDPQKGKKIAKALAREYAENPENVPIVSLRRKIARVATLAKVVLAKWEDLEELGKICRHYDVVDSDDEVLVVSRLARDAIARSMERRGLVDFDDQIWFPHVFGLRPFGFDVVVVDEAQDMNASQLELARKSVRRGGRLVAVGDDRQAIYAWRGADSGFMRRMISELNANLEVLPRTYRCATSIVNEARRLVPDYEADVGNPAGVVRTTRVDSVVDEVRPGDFVISRANAPLMPICLELLRRKVPAYVQGRDVMGRLIGIIERSECDRISEFLEYLEDYSDAEREKLDKIDADEELYNLLFDRVACLRTLAPEYGRTKDMIAALQDMFSDFDDDSKVTLSSAHRSKGLERDRVFLIRKTFRAGGQEDNCLYVAITRAKNELVYAV